MKYVRKDDDEWEETTLLPVQFAPLIEPEEKDIGDGIVEIGECCVINEYYAPTIWLLFSSHVLPI